VATLRRTPWKKLRKTRVCFGDLFGTHCTSSLGGGSESVTQSERETLKITTTEKYSNRFDNGQMIA